jgi:hypothetical protein
MSKYVKIAIAHGTVEISRNSEFSQLDSMVMFHRFLFSLNVSRGNFSERHGQIMGKCWKMVDFPVFDEPGKVSDVSFPQIFHGALVPGLSRKPQKWPPGSKTWMDIAMLIEYIMDQLNQYPQH